MIRRSFAPLCVLVVLLGGVRFAAAQSSDDVASRVGTVARQMTTATPGPWTADALFAAAMTRGNTESQNLRSTFLYTYDDGAKWRFGSYFSAAYETQRDTTTSDRVGLNLSLARKLTADWRLVVIEEILRAPVDGLNRRNLLGSVAVWAPAKNDRLEFNLYGGAGWASEDYTTTQPDADFGALLAGGSATVTLSPTASLTLVEAFTQDLSNKDKFTLGTTVGLKAAVTTVIGTYLTYAVAYDHLPVQGKVSTNNALSAGLTVTFKGAARATK